MCNGKEIMIITGTRKGIGRFLAEYYVKKGFLVAGCSRGKTDFSADNYKHYELDVADEIAVKKMISEVQQKFKKIDILINNAGIALMNHIILTPVSALEKVFNTNFKGSFLFSREVAKMMMKNKYGRIVNFCTVAVPLCLEGEAIYASSKSALLTFTKIMAKELASYNITCNTVGPAPIETDLIKNVPQEKIQDLIEKMAIKKLGNFKDVANVIDFFISKRSNFITGQVIYLGGV